MHWLRGAILALGLAAPALAQDQPDLASLPSLTAPRQLTAADIPHQAIWLEIATTGLYTLALDGPGKIGLTGFRTPNGRSDGSDPQERLIEDGDAYRAGRLENVLLRKGHAYLLQEGVQETRGLTLTLQEPLPDSAPATAEALTLTPGTSLLVQPQDALKLAVTPGQPGLALDVFAPPDADVQARYDEAEIGAGGVFPLGADPATLRIDTRPLEDGSFPLVLLRVRLSEGAHDEVEPGDTDLGLMPATGRQIVGSLRARFDRDAFDFRLTERASLDLMARIEDGGDMGLTLTRKDKAGTLVLLRTPADQGMALRQGLTLETGEYRLEIAGERRAPSAYEISFTAADAALGEPDDPPELARDLAAGTALRGVLGPDNPGHVRFAVPVAGHLWELRGVQGLTDLSMRDANDRDVGTWKAAGGALALRLALPPGTYTARLAGDGPYAIRLNDLGPVPQGFESEPNDGRETALRLLPGTGFAGDFQSNGDHDLYEITLAAPTPLTLTVTPPDDGTIVTELDLAEAGRLQAEASPETGPVAYTATFPAGRHLVTLRTREDGLSGRYALRLDHAAFADPAEPGNVLSLPGDGRLSGSIGGFDTEDRVFVALPEGSGQMVVTCGADWQVSDYGDEAVLARGGRDETGIVTYGPELGGGVELRILANGPVSDYACRAAFTPRPGAAVKGRFALPEDVAPLTYEGPVGLAGLACTGAIPRPRSGDRLAAALNAPQMAGGLYPFLAAPGDAVDLVPPEGVSFPADWSCTWVTDFTPPAGMGKPAAFVGASAAAARVRLAMGRPDWLTPVQVTNDLDIAMDLQGLDQPFRAYSRHGQTGELMLRLTNKGAAAEVGLQVLALADGWRVTAPASVSLPAAGSAEVAIGLDLPPMLSPVTDPQLMVTALAGGKRAALTTPVRVDAAAPDRAPHRFWQAPAALRGGLDPMRHALGGRVMLMDDQPVEPADWAFLHDGDAPQASLPGYLSARQTVFKLAAPAPILGLQVQLRSDEDRGTWPDALTVELSSDGASWGQAMTFALSASDLPQLFALPEVSAAFARVTRHGCRADPACAGVALPEIGLIARPDWRPFPLDLADPALGGHVVTARNLGGRDASESPFDGAWNDGVLQAGAGGNLNRAGDGPGNRVEAIIAFQSSRAARVQAVEWQGNAEDGPRLPGALVEVSLAGPAGPWTQAGTLTAPPQGQLSSRLTLAKPEWARAIRLTFARDAEASLALPDRIRIWEDPTAPSALGLWQGDAPEAGYEATSPEAESPATPSGGADPAQAVVLTQGREIGSSVQLERNEDWWAIEVPEGPKQMISLHFPGAAQPEFVARLIGPDGADLPLARQTTDTDLTLKAAADPGRYLIRIAEPPRSVAILWDTSDSVGPYIPRILDAVRVWASSLKPGRDRIQLLPFGSKDMLLKDWAGTPEEVAPALAALPASNSSDVETAMGLAAEALSAVDGQRGIVVITDAEAAQSATVWTPLLKATPRVVALSIDSSQPSGVRIMQDWAGLNGGYFARVQGSSGLADGLDLAAALFRAPKPYRMTATVETLREPEGQASLSLTTPKTKAKTAPTGGIEVVLDASGSMLQRMKDGQRKIEVAHDALAGLVRDTLPKGTPFAFRAFGLAADDCSSELKLPFAPLNPGRAEQAIRKTPAVNKAKTAIAASLTEAAKDLAGMQPPRVIVLVTDGDETCDGDVAGAIAAIHDQGLDIRLSIVGFDLDDAALAETFAAWAQAGGGNFLPAGDADGLAQSIRAATEPRFAADRLYLDGRVEEVAQIGLTDSATDLPAGRYRLRPLQTAVGAALEIDLADGQSATLTYDPKTGLMMAK